MHVALRGDREGKTTSELQRLCSKNEKYSLIFVQEIQILGPFSSPIKT